MTNPSNIRLAIVLSHPTQYYSPWFRWMAAQGQTLRVFYLWDFGITHQHDPQFGKSFKWDINLLAGYESEFVPNVSLNPGTDHFRGLDNPGLLPRLKAWQPDCVLLFGYKYATHLRLVFRSRWPLIFRGDSHLLGQRNPGLLKRFSLTQIYRRFAAFTYVGQANLAYFSTFGVPAQKLFFAPHCVNESHFSATPAHRAEAATLKEKLGLTGKLIVLFAGKFVAAKQPMELLAAFLSLSTREAAMVFVGDGDQKEALHALAATRPDKNVRFLPFANQSEMPSRYLLADLFALPSRGLNETWGLAVNEAMHLGVPCLVSDRVGCQQDLVTEDETGWVFEATSPQSLQDTLARALNEISVTPDIFRERIAARISKYGYASATEGLQRALAAIAR